MSNRTMIVLAAFAAVIMSAPGCKKGGDNKAGDMAKAGSADTAKAGSAEGSAKAGSAEPAAKP